MPTTRQAVVPKKHSNLQNDLPPEIREELERFKAFLGTQLLRLTRQRKAILREVFRHHGHIDVEELTSRMRNLEVGASRATVYRTLDLLAEAGLVKRVGLGRSQRYYEHVHLGEHHDHLVCTECGRIIEFYSEELEGCQSRVCSEQGFTPVSHTMTIFGKCSECSKTGE